MDRNQAAKLLGIHHSATVVEANQALIKKLNQLDERISTAPNQALTQKYRQMREELIHAVQAFVAETHVQRPSIQSDQLADLPASMPSLTERASDSSLLAESLFDIGESAPVKPPRLASNKPWGLATALVGIMIVVGAIVVGHKPLVQLWDQVRPASEQELAIQKAELAGLQGEIKTLKQRLENFRRSLQQEVSEAERNKSSKLAELIAWQTLTEKFIFNGSRILELEGRLSMGSSLLQEKSFELANTELTKVKVGYEQLLAEYEAAEKIHEHKNRAEQSRDEWYRTKENYGLDNPVSLENAIQTHNSALNELRGGNIQQSLQLWKDAYSAWERTKMDVASKVSNIESHRAAEAKRLVELKTQRELEKKETARQAIIAEQKEKLRLEEERIAAEKRKKQSIFERFEPLLGQWEPVSVGFYCSYLSGHLSFYKDSINYSKQEVKGSLYITTKGCSGYPDTHRTTKGSVIAKFVRQNVYEFEESLRCKGYKGLCYPTEHIYENVRYVLKDEKLTFTFNVKGSDKTVIFKKK